MPAGVPPTSRPTKGPSSSPSMPARGKAPPPVSRPAPPIRTMDDTPIAAAAPIPAVAPPQHRPKYMPQPLSTSSVPLIPPRQRPSVSRAAEHAPMPTIEVSAGVENANEFWRSSAQDVVPASLYPAADQESSFYVETAADLVEPADDTNYGRRSSEASAENRTADGQHEAAVDRASIADVAAVEPLPLPPSLASVTVSQVADDERLATTAPLVVSSDERHSEELFAQPQRSAASIRESPLSEPSGEAAAQGGDGTVAQQRSSHKSAGVHSLVVNDEDDDDDAFFVSSRSAANMRDAVVERTMPPPSFLEPPAAAPATGHLHQALHETPQSLRRLLSDGDSDDARVRNATAVQEAMPAGGNNEPATSKRGEPAPSRLGHQSSGLDAGATTSTAAMDRGSRRTVVQPEMDFTVDPIDTWFEKEEQQRQKDRERAGQRQKSVRLSEETLKRLSQPRKPPAGTGAASSSVPVASQSASGGDEAAPMSRESVEDARSPHPVQSVGAAEPPLHPEIHWAPSAAAERPNETHYFIEIGVFHQHHRVALGKRTTLASIGEALRLFEIGGVLAKGATKLSWESTPLSLGLQPGVQHVTALRFISTLEVEEELHRRALRTEAVGWVAHRLAFSEWILRCSEQMSRHVFFDATGAFDDLS